MVECDSLAEGTFCGTSFLGRVIVTEDVAGEDLWGREWASGMGPGVSPKEASFQSDPNEQRTIYPRPNGPWHLLVALTCNGSCFDAIKSGVHCD